MLRAAVCLGIVPLLAVLLSSGLLQQFAVAVRMPGAMHPLTGPPGPKQYGDISTEQQQVGPPAQGRHLVQWSNTPPLTLSSLGLDRRGGPGGRRLEEVAHTMPQLVHSRGPLHPPGQVLVVPSAALHQAAKLKGAREVGSGIGGVGDTWGDSGSAWHAWDMWRMRNSVLDGMVNAWQSMMAVVPRAAAQLHLPWPCRWLPTAMNISSTACRGDGAKLGIAVGTAAAGARLESPRGAHGAPPDSATGHAAEAGLAVLGPLPSRGPAACAGDAWLRAEIPAVTPTLLPPCQQPALPPQHQPQSTGRKEGLLPELQRMWASGMVPLTTRLATTPRSPPAATTIHAPPVPASEPQAVPFHHLDLQHQVKDEHATVKHPATAVQRRQLQQIPPGLPPLPSAQELAAMREAMGDVEVPGVFGLTKDPTTGASVVRVGPRAAPWLTVKTPAASPVTTPQAPAPSASPVPVPASMKGVNSTDSTAPNQFRAAGGCSNTGCNTPRAVSSAGTPDQQLAGQQRADSEGNIGKGDSQQPNPQPPDQPAPDVQLGWGGSVFSMTPQSDGSTALKVLGGRAADIRIPANNGKPSTNGTATIH